MNDATPETESDPGDAESLPGWAVKVAIDIQCGRCASVLHEEWTRDESWNPDEGILEIEVECETCGAELKMPAVVPFMVPVGEQVDALGQAVEAWEAALIEAEDQVTRGGKRNPLEVTAAEARADAIAIGHVPSGEHGPVVLTDIREHHANLEREDGGEPWGHTDKDGVILTRVVDSKDGSVTLNPPGEGTPS